MPHKYIFWAILFLTLWLCTPIAYAAAERFWSYPTLVIIALGAWRQHRGRTGSHGLPRQKSCRG